MARREFSKKVYAEIVKRAMLPNGEIACEGCGLILGKKPYHVDHIKPDALEIDKSQRLTAKDGQLLGVECCHKPKTKQDIAVIAEAKRREEKHLGMKRPTSKLATKDKSPKRLNKQLPPRKRDVFGHPVSEGIPS
ncbi:hypothetical protein ACFOLL_13175 [Falsochrobactrum ovis]|uniref:Uncharacterized protein n=1 Tax=Falsochrobactrum ovis TaxID=1293442 RepID=A0A364JTU6_9HYPH|nr:hypothetical protein [Falsochrobactrum ovis]RAK27059.1 hypothetical protein C7374_11153 [Falsochrobactrum ovis]